MFSHNNVIFLIKSIDLFENRDFLFESFTQTNLILFAHLINHIIIDVFIKNETNSSIQISRKFKFNNVFEMNYENCF